MFYVGGAVQMRNRGVYAGGTTYFAYDFVSHEGSTYIATTTTTGNMPPNAAYWAVLAAGTLTGVVSSGKWGSD